MDEEMFLFWNFVKKELKEKSWTVVQLAEKTGISESYIRASMSRSQIPNVLTAQKIADALDCSIEYLLTGEEKIIVKTIIPEDLQNIINKYSTK